MPLDVALFVAVEMDTVEFDDVRPATTTADNNS